MREKVFLTILDGWGLRKEKEWNAIATAKTPNYDYLTKEYPFTFLTASGEAVGLPEGQMGNSEVGHLNIGAGRIVETGLYRINQSIKRGEFKSLESVKDLFKELERDKGSNLHILILASKGGVHSHLEHLYAFLELSKTYSLSPFIHLFSDGRDVPPKQFLGELEEIEKKLRENNAMLATISGRYYAMDRDKNWERVEKVLRVFIRDKDINVFKEAKEFVRSQYEEGITDEFILPSASSEYFASSGLKDGDKLVFLNFRPDRAKELSHLLVGSRGLYNYSSELSPKKLSLYAMMDYEKLNTAAVFFPPLELKNTLGELVSSSGLSQLRAAESEKYPHVTYFFDGGVERDLKNISKIIIPSPKVGTYDKAPEMSIYELYDAVEKGLKLKDCEMVVLNLANPDMVGHSGDFEATVKACEAVDRVLGQIYQLCKSMNFTLLVIADHGNADRMRNELGEPHTAHTTAPVPCILCRKAFGEKPINLRQGGKLGDVAPTIIYLLGIKQPKEMNGESLIVR